MSEELNTTPEASNKAIQPVTLPNEPTPAPEPPRKDHGQVLLVLNIVMLLGLVALYIMFFTRSSTGDSGVAKSLRKINSGSLGIAYVNSDSILANYALVKKMRGDLTAKSSRLEAEIAAKQKAYEKDAAYFQEQVKNKSISEQSAQEVYQSIMKEQQNIVDLRDKYSADLQQHEFNLNVMLLDSVTNFLKRYNTQYKFDYILGYNKGGNIYLANDTLDITKDVIREINKEYFAKHPDEK
ncbi:MAG TPA: OmpH family outer membrane protein [Bacteroidales bacterium]